MRLGGRESDHIEDRRGAGGGRGRMPGGRSIGIGTIVLALVALYFGVDPAVVLDLGGTGPAQVSVAPSGPAGVQSSGNAAEDETARFVARVLADTEDTWQALFAAAGGQYREPTLVLYAGGTGTACGLGQAAMGPFYCPTDRKVYLDLSFYEELRRRFGAPGDFAQAYVLAHEVGHHVQNLLGISDKVQAARGRVSQAQGNALSVRLELQADCFAGLWAHHADRSRGILEAGDVEEALAAATAIGDDTLQQQARGYAVPESFTHGSAQQRVRWFRRGLESGRVGDCDTFEARTL